MSTFQVFQDQFFNVKIPTTHVLSKLTDLWRSAKAWLAVTAKSRISVCVSSASIACNHRVLRDSIVALSTGSVKALLLMAFMVVNIGDFAIPVNRLLGHVREVIRSVVLVLLHK